MAEDLQNLLERIQKEGVDRAQAEAEQISPRHARKRAIVAQATEEAATTRAAGDREAQAFMDRAAVTLEQVARDYLLRVQRDLEALFLESVRGDLAEALTPSSLRSWSPSSWSPTRQAHKETPSTSTCRRRP